MNASGCRSPPWPSNGTRGRGGAVQCTQYSTVYTVAASHISGRAPPVLQWLGESEGGRRRRDPGMGLEGSSAGPVLEDSRLEGMVSNWRPQGGECPRTSCWTGGPEAGGDCHPVGSLKAGGSINQHRWRAKPAPATTADFSTTLLRSSLLRLVIRQL